MDFKLPDIGEGVHEGEIVRWLVKEGDNVTVDQPLVEVMTDKATVEIPTSVAGRVSKISAKAGDLVKVGQTILVLEEGAASAKPTTAASRTPAPKPAAPQQRPMPTAPQRPPLAATAPPVTQAPQAPKIYDATYVASPGNTLATPATRRLARDLGVDLTQVEATGPQGRVTKEDVQRFAGASAAGPQVPVQSPGTRLTYAPPQIRPQGSETLIPFRGVRRKIAEAMSHSRTTIPEFTYVDECDITELVAFRKEAKPEAEKHGVKLTYLPFIIKAMVRALREYPTLNATLDEQGGNVVVKHYYNIGIAVDTDAGLMVPVVKNVESKSILQIAGEIQALAEKARHGKLALADMQGATITITNPGPIGGLITAPVINWPEVAIMGVHKIVRRPIVKEVNGKEEIAIADMIYLSIAVDHRVVDGATAARFMNRCLELLASPKKLMLDMA